MKASHTYLNKLKKLESIDDYKKLLMEDYSSRWENACIDEIVDCFGIPKQYPCFIANQYINCDPEWGDGIEKYYHFYYL